MKVFKDLFKILNNREIDLQNDNELKLYKKTCEIDYN